jgi:hypothetical protein
MRIVSFSKGTHYYSSNEIWKGKTVRLEKQADDKTLHLDIAATSIQLIAFVRVRIVRHPLIFA